MAKVYLILGGARSGKSSYGEELAASISGKVAYLATAKITDREMEKRIAAHRRRRPKEWTTFELGKNSLEKKDIKKMFHDMEKQGHSTVLIDCITNMLFRLIDGYELDKLETISNKLEIEIEKKVLGFFKFFIKLIKSTGLNVIIISNEIGLGVVPAFPLGRIFRDLMGMINKDMAAGADEVYFFIAGLKQRLK
ncbi:MAG: bifunctional adenosylcobinamide kinase/adenosylcobinamide-phosphate guanylyltransferase [Actinomycetota bacterium]|nr:MAG: bifunctional adenosylcobinamide kinase/adenosylcobinamide-phosphate guanylyltransferase [Actinomycetota bacterium]